MLSIFFLYDKDSISIKKWLVMLSIRFLVGLLSTVFLPLSVYAGGIMLYEIGSQDVGLASAGWSSRAQDASTAFTNPAGMSRFSCRELELGAQPIYANIIFDPDSQTNVRGKRGDANQWLPAGGFFYVEPINECWSAGVSVVGYFGSKLNFNDSWVGRYYVTETLLQGFSLVPAISCKVTSKLSVGLGVNVMYGIFKQKSKINNRLDSQKDGSLKLYDDDFGFGCIAGLLYEFTPHTRVGLQYISKVRLQFKSKPHFHDIGPILEAELTRTGLINSQVSIDANVPQGIMLSAYHDLFSCLSLMADVGWQEWSNFQKATITLGTNTAASLTTTPNYKDTWHFAVGAQYRFSDCLDFMTGFAYDTSAISEKNRPLDFPVGRQWRYGIGSEWRFRQNMFVGVQYEFQSQGDLGVDVNRGRLAGHVSGEFNNVYIHFINFNYQWIF